MNTYYVKEWILNFLLLKCKVAIFKFLMCFFKIKTQVHNYLNFRLHFFINCRKMSRIIASAQIYIAFYFQAALVLIPSLKICLKILI